MKGILIKKKDHYNNKEIYYSLIINDECIGTTHNVFNKEMKDNNENVVFNKLSKKNCDEIFVIVNIEKLAEEYSDKEYGGGQSPSYFSGFSDGFNKAMELNKDKVFTLEDIKKAYIQGKHGGKTQAYVEFDDYIQSLQQPNEIEVEIEMECCGNYSPPCNINCEYGCKPKLDSSGCIILTKKI
jgi:hypothetical protein